MISRSTAEIFIKKAILIHGNKYDYSNVIYINNQTKIEIICKKHKSFFQKPRSHLSGQGCMNCYIENITGNTNGFIDEAIKIHGNKYDYSKVKYIKNKIPVIIICPKHKEFSQLPAVHLRGSGCKKCSTESQAKTTSHTTERFIEKATKVHFDRFDYSKVNYVNRETKVEIICKEHGSFCQEPSNHLKGFGCAQCGNENRRLSLTTFIKKANEIHSNKYDYSLTEYKTSTIKIKIICPYHGVFLQVPGQHLKGSGCRKCFAESERLTLQQFIDRGNMIHNYKYDYSLVNYICTMTKIIIICPVHKEFLQAPSVHLSGSGCRKCGDLMQGKSKSSNVEDFTAKSIKIHGNKYDYGNVKYINGRTKVKIICTDHGEFLITPESHLGGHGCKKCSNTISKSEIKWLDSLNIPEEYRQYSIKIEGKKRGYIVDGFNPLTKTVYEFNGDFWHGNPKFFDPDMENPANFKTFGELYKQTLDRQMLLKNAGYNIVSIWESDFINSSKKYAKYKTINYN